MRRIIISFKPARPECYNPFRRTSLPPGENQAKVKFTLYIKELPIDPSLLRRRYRRIMTFFTLATASIIFWEILLPRLGLRRFSRRTRSQRMRSLASRFCSMAVRMGGVMIKVGQFLSARLDVLPPEVTEELSRLQDEVPSEDFERMRQLAEQELGRRLEDLFESFDPAPLAAASLGQVHRAVLRPEDPSASQFRNVVLKIQRPFIDQLIEVDLSTLRRVGGWLEHYPPIRKRVDVRALIDEFAFTIRQEIDYLNEGKNAETFAANFKDQPRVHVPRVVWSHTTQRVLALEDVFAIKITDYSAITAAGIERSEVATELLATYLKQVFEDGFFHADPHPGNLFVTPMPEKTADGKTAWRLTFVDFGMAGTVPENLRTGLREMLIAVGTKDAARVVRSYQMLNMLLPGADIELIQQAEAQVFERFWGLSMNDLRQINHAEIFKFAHQFRELMYSMPFQVPHNLLLLGRTIAILSGMCTGLDPQFNVWNQLAPFAQRLVADEALSNWRVWLNEIGELLRVLLALPAQAGRVMTQLERGTLNVQAPEVSRQILSLERSINRLNGSLVFAALLLGSIFLYNDGNTLYAKIVLGAALVALGWAAITGRRR